MLTLAVWLLPLCIAILAAVDAVTLVHAVDDTVESLVSVTVTHCGPAVFNVKENVSDPAFAAVNV